jgi:AraC family transcriptional regulator
LARRGDAICESTAYIGCSYDDPAVTGDETTLRYDACIGVAPGVRVEGLTPREISGGRFAVTRHRGPYQLIGHSFDAMISALVLTQRVDVRDEPFLEIHLNRPNDVAPSDLETDLAIPVR